MITIDMNDKEKGLVDLYNALPKYNSIPVVAVYKDGTKKKMRLGRMGSSEILEMRKGSRKYGTYFRGGYSINPISFINISIKTDVDESKKWETGWKKVLARLEKSGLYEDYADNIRLALEVGYEKMQEAYKAYWKDYNNEAENVKMVEPKLIKVDKEGKEYPNTECIWYMSKMPKVKKMYFGKYYNDSYLERIANAFANKEEIKVFSTAGYDVSFHYKPESKKAWYSEEYRNCGNGHYYLALDATHAVFYEDD